MKKIFFAIAIIFVSLNCIGQGVELKVNKNGEIFNLHPTNPNGLNTEKVTTFTTNYEGAVIVNERTIQYEVVDASKIAIQNNNKIRNFAITEMSGIGVGLVGYALTRHGANNMNTKEMKVGAAIIGVGGLVCIIGYIPLLNNDKIYFTENGIGVKLRIK